jgi:hypothetical protein
MNLSLRRVEPISWKSFFQVRSDPMITLQIIPDQTVHSGRAVESILNTFHSMYEGLMERVWNEGVCIVFKTKDYASFRIVYEAGRISFFIAVPSAFQLAVTNCISNVWPNAAVNVVPNPILNKFNPERTLCAYVELKEHYFKSILVDRTQNRPIPSLMAAGRNLIEDDLAVLDIAFVPVSDRWRMRAKSARNKHRRGKEVKKAPSRISDFLFIIGDLLVDGVLEKIFGLFDMMFGAEKTKEEEDELYFNRDIYLLRQLAPSTEQKYEHSGFDTVIRIASQSESRKRAEQTLTAIGTAFKDLTADNEFQIVRVHKSAGFIKRLEKDKLPLIRINGNILSIPECSQLVQLPSNELQQEYPEIENIKMKETDIDKRLTQGGILLGTATHKTNTTEVYQPINDYDELCLPNVGIGGMGQGKTIGLCANWLVEMYRNGFGGLAIDAAKRQIGDEIQRCVDLGVIPKEDFIRIDFGTQPLSLDWSEAVKHEKGKSRLAATVIDFFDLDAETTGQTGRFLRAAVLGMKTGKLTEIFDIFENEERLQEAIDSLPEDGMARKTLVQYQHSSPDRRRQLISPIYNRLDTILGDEYLAECMESNFVLDMTQIMSQRKIIVFDFPDDELVQSQQDVLINLVCSKIDLATRLRKKLYGDDAEFPFAVVMDEPHKYLRSARIWESNAVEARKWKIGYFWTFHYWEQIPAQLQKAIRNALPHYHLYPSSKLTFKSLEEEIKPFTIEDALKLKRFHAINIIRAGGENVTPFIAEMALPPSQRFKKTNKKIMENV